MAVTMFFCYAHEDEPLLNRLKTHLRPLQRQGLIDVWYDREISAGAEWEQDIDKHLNTAQIILLLVSPAFMDSDYCYKKEMGKAIERHKRGEARVIPIILHHVLWEGSPFDKLQVLPTDAKPIISSAWHSSDEAFFNVVKGISKAVKELDRNLAASNKANPRQTHSTEQSQYDMYSGYAPQPQVAIPSQAQILIPSPQVGNPSQIPNGSYAQPPVNALGTTSLGWSPNIAAGLSYLFGWITGIIILLLERKNHFVRFHAMQSILTFGATTVLTLSFSILSTYISNGFLTEAFSIFNPLLSLSSFVLWLILMVTAFTGRYFKIPLIGNYAEKFSIRVRRL